MLKINVELNNNVLIPSLGLGTSLRHKPNKVDNEQFVESVKYSINIGYRHIDTAKCYNNEHLIGQAIKESGIDRKDIFLVTKLFPDDMGYDKALKAFDKSCKQLKVDYIDLYLIHFPGKLRGQINDLEKSKELRLETWKALEKLYSDGKCRAIGVSNYMPRHLQEIIDAGMTIPAVNQCEFHPYYNNKELLDFCHKIGIQFVGYSPLGKGNLLNDPIVKSLSEKYSKSCAQILLNWSIRIFDFRLSDEDVDLLWTLNKNEKVSWDPTNII